MKVRLLILFILTLSIASCRKSTKHVIPEPMSVPWYPDWLMSSIAAMPVNFPAYANTWGLLVATEMTARLTDTGGVERDYFVNWESASFLATSGKKVTYGNAGSVLLNGVSIGYNTDYWAYRVYDTISNWHNGSSNNWTIGGSKDVTAFSADIDGTMPRFMGMTPATISMSADLSMTFDSDNVADADSAFFVINYYGVEQVSNVVSGRTGTATIAKTKMKSLVNILPYSEYMLPRHKSSPITDSSVFSGGLFMVVLFNHVTKNIGGKDFVFVRQVEHVRSVKVID